MADAVEKKLEMSLDDIVSGNFRAERAGPQAQAERGGFKSERGAGRGPAAGRGPGKRSWAGAAYADAPAFRGAAGRGPGAGAARGWSAGKGKGGRGRADASWRGYDGPVVVRQVRPPPAAVRQNLWRGAYRQAGREPAGKGAAPGRGGKGAGRTSPMEVLRRVNRAGGILKPRVAARPQDRGRAAGKGMARLLPAAARGAKGKGPKGGEQGDRRGGGSAGGWHGDSAGWRGGEAAGGWRDRGAGPVVTTVATYKGGKGKVAGRGGSREDRGGKGSDGGADRGWGYSSGYGDFDGQNGRSRWSGHQAQARGGGGRGYGAAPARDEARPDRGRANSSWYVEDGWRRSRSVDRGGKEPSYDKPGFRKADAPRRPVDNPYSRSRGAGAGAEAADDDDEAGPRRGARPPPPAAAERRPGREDRAGAAERRHQERRPSPGAGGRGRAASPRWREAPAERPPRKTSANERLKEEPAADDVLSAEDRRMMKKITIVAQLDKVPEPLAAMGAMAPPGRGSKRGDGGGGALSSRFAANFDR